MFYIFIDYRTYITLNQENKFVKMYLFNILITTLHINGINIKSDML